MGKGDNTQKAREKEEAFQRDPMADINSGRVDSYYSARRAGIGPDDAARETIYQTQQPGQGFHRRNRD